MARWLLALAVSVCWACDRRPRMARNNQISGIKQPEATVVQENGEVTRVSRGMQSGKSGYKMKFRARDSLQGSGAGCISLPNGKELTYQSLYSA